MLHENEKKKKKMKMKIELYQEKFILLPQEKIQGPGFKVSFERVSPENDTLVWSLIPTLTELNNALLDCA